MNKWGYGVNKCEIKILFIFCVNLFYDNYYYDCYYYNLFFCSDLLILKVNFCVNICVFRFLFLLIFDFNYFIEIFGKNKQLLNIIKIYDKYTTS